MRAGPPAVTIHGLEDGEMVLRLRRPVTLLSAPGAALYAGAGWWRALIATLRARHPDRVFTDVLDCADAPGRAAEALRAGQTRILFYPENPANVVAVQAMAEACGAEVWTARPEALDLAVRGADRKLAAWLAGPETSG
ncbi:hypothetical protein ACELLULO517_19640 [Acidisoma cellulosilytica]|uniref:Uncharacterized protein n=1 Tax=Acidisoma cellulosilyticum TaxID=2802395 RepID=A0A963Z5L0_9PROT|nr:hypothetical protein [Acidisoma cellulosilyticum]MCB8882470.1 hypothetical protein [Acidisoma cellulosilyticum]